jgi:hypothetical protein
MAKKPWYAKIFKGAEVHVIKTRARKDKYFYEIVRPNKPTLKWNPKITEEIGHYPDLEDTWHSGKVDGQMFDLNIMDSYQFGTAKTGLGAGFYEVLGKGTKDDLYETNTEEWVNVPVKCFLQDRKGNRKPLPFNKKSKDFLHNFAIANPNE